ncbi:MAG: heme NO-binding domain-containing protein [Bacteroidota bacterium]
MQDNHQHIHGSIFFLLRKFIINNYSEEMWHILNAEAHVEESGIEMTKSYDLSDILGIMQTASTHTNLSIKELQEKFGEYLVPDLFKIYGNYLNPNWKTFDVLLNTETVMHGAVRKLNSTAHPPILNVSQVNEHLLIIDYHSKRKLASLAVGIIKGIANYFNESRQVHVKPTTEADAERVQIRVEFHPEKNEQHST